MSLCPSAMRWDTACRSKNNMLSARLTPIDENHAPKRIKAKKLKDFTGFASKSILIEYEAWGQKFER